MHQFQFSRDCHAGSRSGQGIHYCICLRPPSAWGNTSLLVIHGAFSLLDPSILNCGLRPPPGLCNWKWGWWKIGSGGKFLNRQWWKHNSNSNLRCLCQCLVALNHGIIGLDFSLVPTQHKPCDTNEPCLKHLSLHQRQLDNINYSTFTERFKFSAPIQT